VHVQAVALHDQVFAIFLHQLGKVFSGCFAERQRQLAALGQVQPTGLRILARLVDKFLGLCARCAVGFAPNDAVNALPVDHDIDANTPSPLAWRSKVMPCSLSLSPKQRACAWPGG
jgi:hypothetical protein